SALDDTFRADAPVATPGVRAFPHVVAWNLTRRCNLECAHCYISAGPQASMGGELSTLECLHVAAQVLAVNPSPLLILTGGVRLEAQYRGRVMVRSKCQPQIMRHAHESAPDSPLLNYETRCPCAVQYCRITPDGKVTPCPYIPEVAGDLRRQSFAEVWSTSPL